MRLRTLQFVERSRSSQYSSLILSEVGSVARSPVGWVLQTVGVLNIFEKGKQRPHVVGNGDAVSSCRLITAIDNTYYQCSETSKSWTHWGEPFRPL